MDFLQIFVNYWWIFALGIILDLAISKNVIRFVVVSAMTLVACAAIWYLVLDPAYKTAAKCFTDEVTKVSDIDKKAEDIYDQEELTRFVCNERHKSMDRLTECLRIAKVKNPLGTIVYSKLPQYKQALKASADKYKSLCPDREYTLPNL
ncbi:MAG: hypothetical protein U0525_04540 [Patescibacteria group bacterium]